VTLFSFEIFPELFGKQDLIYAVPQELRILLLSKTIILLYVIIKTDYLFIRTLTHCLFWLIHLVGDGFLGGETWG
jgi:hypothetical protein